MSEHQYAVVCSFMVFLVMILIVVLFLIYFFKSDAWKYITASKQKSWKPDFLLEGEELKVVRRPFSYPENKIVAINYGYKHEVITSDEDVIIYWKRSDFNRAVELYNQIK